MSLAVDSDEEVLARIPGPASTESAAGARLELRAVEEALRVLPEHYRTVVVLRDVYDLTHEDIAAELGISETAAKVRLHRARRRLRELVFPLRGEEDAHAV